MVSAETSYYFRPKKNRSPWNFYLKRTNQGCIECIFSYAAFGTSGPMADGSFINSLASVAQLVELLICNQWVGGSSPSAGSSVDSWFYGGVPEWSKGTDCKSVGEAFGGSNPPPTTTVFGKLL